MSNIRIRAWDKQERKMLDADTLLVNKDGTVISIASREGSEPPLDSAFDCKRSNDVVLMQFTGLTDKNGKEIWEGDIVRLCLAHFAHLAWERGEKPDLSDERICTVEVDNLTAYLVENYDSVWVLDTLEASYVHHEEASLEVIGNIYENPELLKESTDL